MSLFFSRKPSHLYSTWTEKGSHYYQEANADSTYISITLKERLIKVIKVYRQSCPKTFSSIYHSNPMVHEPSKLEGFFRCRARFSLAQRSPCTTWELPLAPDDPVFPAACAVATRRLGSGFPVCLGSQKEEGNLSDVHWVQANVLPASIHVIETNDKLTS